MQTFVVKRYKIPKEGFVVHKLGCSKLSRAGFVRTLGVFSSYTEAFKFSRLVIHWDAEFCDSCSALI